MLCPGGGPGRGSGELTGSPCRVSGRTTNCRPRGPRLRRRAPGARGRALSPERCPRGPRRRRPVADGRSRSMSSPTRASPRSRPSATSGGRADGLRHRARPPHRVGRAAQHERPEHRRHRAARRVLRAPRSAPSTSRRSACAPRSGSCSSRTTASSRATRRIAAPRRRDRNSSRRRARRGASGRPAAEGDPHRQCGDQPDRHNRVAIVTVVYVDPPSSSWCRVRPWCDAIATTPWRARCSTPPISGKTLTIGATVKVVPQPASPSAPAPVSFDHRTS